MLRKSSNVNLDTIENEYDIYEELLNSNINSVVKNEKKENGTKKKQQRRRSLSNQEENTTSSTTTKRFGKLKIFRATLFALCFGAFIITLLSSSSSFFPENIFSFFSSSYMLPRSVQNNLAEIKDPLTNSDVLFFWHNPRSAGTTFKIIASKCLGFVVASEAGNLISSDTKTLKVVELVKPQGKFVNVDVTTISGIKKAKTKGLVKSGLPELISSGYFFEITSLFDPKHKGRVFTFMRDPVERSLSLYQSLTMRKSFQLSIEEYAQSSIFIDNWMVRQLCGKHTGKVNKKNLELAKKILKEKVVIGLTSDTLTSFRLFEYFFGWKLSHTQQKCASNMLKKDWAKQNTQSLQVMGEEKAMKILRAVNEFDVQLFEYAKELFSFQSRLATTEKDR